MTYNYEQGRRQGVPPTYGESAASGPAPTTAGHHHHDILNKLDPRVDSTRDRAPMATSSGGGAPEGTYGPHKSRIANALDPRVDSDMDHRGTTGTGTTTMHGVGGRRTGPMGTGSSDIPEGTYGPHRSRMANALDPRVDSDRDRGAGRHAGPLGAGMGTGTSSGVPEGTYGPHNSRMANALDPRVDSDRDNRGAGYPAGGVTGTGYGHDTYTGSAHQPGSMGLGSSTGHSAGNHAINRVSGPGPAPNTAGPHKSDLLNKLDPRVDSKAGIREPGYEPRRGI